MYLTDLSWSKPIPDSNESQSDQDHSEVSSNTLSSYHEDEVAVVNEGSKWKSWRTWIIMILVMYSFTSFYPKFRKLKRSENWTFFPGCRLHTKARIWHQTWPETTHGQPRSQLCLSVPTSQMHVVSAAHKYFCLFYADFFYLEDCENV